MHHINTAGMYNFPIHENAHTSETWSDRDDIGIPDYNLHDSLYVIASLKKY